MYLKSIEIHGFKSFANKITFQFHNGITGIVGPNGSGKSNVADAVRWVLGEQRIKQLRGASMQDVIFSGTETRKPLSYAFVAITLDNSDHQLSIDFDEVTVARRIYRSGESEYLINGAICRLKDVNELFYDTGIGKEGYSIIGQGQIDKILSGKPEERRELFDEAAGIVKFKRRKATAQTKLDNEKQNLIRVNDILTELEKQVGPLERQSEVAREYLKKKEALKTLDVNVFLLENNRLKEQLKAVSEKYELASADFKDTNDKYEGIKLEYERIQEKIDTLEAAIEEARTHLTDSGLSREKLEGQINVLKEQIHSAKGSELHLSGRQKTLRSQIAEKNQERELLLCKKSEIDIEVQQVLASRDEKAAGLEAIRNEMITLNRQIEDSKNSIIQELNQRATIKSKLGRFDTMTEQMTLRKAQLRSRLLRAKSDEEAREENIQKLEEAFEQAAKELQVLREEEAAKEQELGDIREELTDKDNTLRDLQVKYHQEKSRLDALVNLTERYEGYGGSVKKIMEQKENEPGIVGVVADIIKVESKFETAIETALGGSIQNIVTKDEETAKKMIRYLKSNRLGRATFLPLTSIGSAQSLNKEALLKENGVLGLASELVQVEEQYRSVARSLLGRVVVVDHMDHAVQIAGKYHYSVRMVTLEGELLVPGGAISGGAFRNSSNLLGRRREIEALEKQIQKLLASIEQVNGEIEKVKSRRNQLRAGAETLRLRIQNQSIEQNTARLNVTQARERMEEEEEGYLSLKQEQRQMEAQLLEIQNGKETIAQELAESEALELQMQEQIKVFQKKLEERHQEELEIDTQVGEWERNAQRMQQTQVFHQTNVERITSEAQKLVQELSEIEQALQENTLQVQAKQQEILQMEQGLNDFQKAQTQAQDKLKEDQMQREVLRARQKNFFQSREELSERMASLDKEVYRLNAQREKLEESMEAQINYMWEEYEITLSAAASIREEQMTDLGAMKREIAALKDQIKRLGDINVNAIEDYKNLMERYTFMKTQHDDLVEAEKTLEHIIQELDSAMRRQFTEKFAEICREFDKVFKELFGGGKGTLELMEGEDILEAGIRIIAQPPGKKLQNMMQLSGGEKALAAIALLFAIQNLKPSPFCLLDEIEAALDESNVGRFAKYLHKLTRNTQFIVITHRRGTMEQVDRLYGITMQEKGVSALVSVNLIDKELDD